MAVYACRKLQIILLFFLQLFTHWPESDIDCCCQRILLSIPTRSYKSQITDYDEITGNPTPGDLVMSTVEEIQHPAYAMKELIDAKYIFIGKVKYFTYIREVEGVKELLEIDWSFILEDPRKYEVPPTLSSRVKNVKKRQL